MTFPRNRDDNNFHSNHRGIEQTKSTKYIKLEERRVLNATFAFDLVAAELTLENFVDSGIGDNSVDISQSGNDYIFSLNDGIWAPSGSVAGLDFLLSDNDSVLTIGDGALNLQSLVFNDTTSDTFDIRFDQFNFGSGSLLVNSGIGTFGTISTASASSAVSIGAFLFSAENVDFTLGNHDFDLVNGLTADDTLLTDVDDLQIQALQSNNGSISIVAGGSVNVVNPGSFISVLSGGEISITTTDINSDINVSSSIFSFGGNINLESADQVLLSSGSSIVSETSGNVSILANVVGGDDRGEIRMQQDSLIDAAMGTVSLTTSNGSGSGDIFVTEVFTQSFADDAVSIVTSGRILDGTLGESTNVSAIYGGLQLTSIENIGGSGFADLNIAADRLAFHSEGSVFITDVSENITIDSLGALHVSTAAEGLNLAAFNLVVSTNIYIHDSSTLFTNRFGVADNDITINAAIILDSSTPAKLTINSADDIIFDGGSVSTMGSDSHEVELLADRESVMDGDIGSITNTENGPANTISTNYLTISSGDGIGDSSDNDVAPGQALRIDADFISAENMSSSGIRIIDSNSIAIFEVTNVGRNIQFTAEMDLVDGDALTDDLDFDGGSVLLTSNLGSIGSGSTDIFKVIESSPIEIKATDSVEVNAFNGLVAINSSIVVPTTIHADTAVLVSNDDLDVSQVDFNTNNLALIADANNDGNGTLVIPQHISVTEDLRVEGHQILAFDGFTTLNHAELTADRLFLSTDTTLTLATTVNQLDVEFDSGVIPSSLTPNRFLQVDNSTDLQLVDLNCDTHSILSSSDDVKIIAAGNIDIQSSVELRDATFFVVAAGDLTQQAGTFVHSTQLGLMVAGDSILNQNNNVVEFAANNGGLTVFNDIDQLTLTEVVFAPGSSEEMMVRGITVSNGDAILIVNNTLSVEEQVTLPDGDLLLRVEGDVLQSANSQISAIGLGMIVDGDAVFSGRNNVQTIAADNRGLLIFDNVVDLEVGNVVVANDSIFELAVTGIFNDQDVKLGSLGDLEISNAISIAGSLLLDTNGNVSQSIAGTINAAGLGLKVDGQAILDQGNNVMVFAADNQLVHWYNDVDNLEIGIVTVAADTQFEMSLTGIESSTEAKISTGSDLSISQSINVATTLFLDVGNDLQQSLSSPIISASLGLMVGGSTELLANNNVDEIAAAVGNSIVFNNENDLIVGSVHFAPMTSFSMNVEGITTMDSDVMLISRDLQIDHRIDSNSGNVFLDVDGNLQQSEMAGIISASLGLQVTGLSVLNADNHVDELAASIGGNAEFNDIDGLVINSVTVGSGTSYEMSLTGVDASGDIKLTVGGNFFVDQTINATGQTVFLDVEGNLSQSELGTIQSLRLGLMVDGKTTLTSANDVAILAANNGDQIIFNNTGDLEVGIVAHAPGSDFEMVVTGISTNVNDAKLEAASLSLQASIDVDGARLFLISDGDLVQSDNGIIKAGSLGLMVSNATILDAANEVNFIGAENGSITIFNSVGALAVSDVSIAEESPYEMAISGISVSNNDLKLSSGDLLIESSIEVAGNIFIASSGTVSQLTAGTISTNGLGTMVAGSSTFVADNQIVTFAANNDGPIVLNNVADLAIGTVVVAAETPFEMTAQGLTTNNADAKLTIRGNLTIENEIHVGNAAVLLQVESDLSQADSGTIVARGLGLTVSGETILKADNHVDVLAANNFDKLIFNDINDLRVAEVSVLTDSEFGTTISGISNTTDTKLTVGGNLSIDSDVSISNANLFISAGGTLSQDSATILSANQFGLLAQGDTFLAGENDVDVFAANSRGNVVFNDVDDLVIGTATVFSGTEHEMFATGIRTENSDSKIITGSHLRLAASVETGSGNLILTVATDLEQTNNGTIHANGLGLMVSGETILDSDNEVKVLGVLNGGFTQFNGLGNLNIGNVSVLQGTDFQMVVTGIETSDDDTKLSTSGNLLVSERIQIGTGNFFASVNGNLDQLETAAINATGFGMMVDGSTRLSANNDVSHIAASNGGQIVFNDINDLTISNVSVANMHVTGITSADSDLKIVTGSDLFVDNFVDVGDGNILLTVNGSLFQTATGGDGIASTITANGLGLMVGGSTSLSESTNAIDVLAGDQAGGSIIANSQAIEIGQVFVDGMNIKGFAEQSDLVLLVDGDLNQTAAISITGDTLLRVNGDICLTGANCSIDGLNENDFVGRIDVIAFGSVEIADRNDLDVGNISAADQISLRSGDGQTGAIELLGTLSTSDSGGQILLQSDRGIQQTLTSVIQTDNLLLGSSSEIDARQGNVILNGENVVENLAANLDARLEFTNRRNLQITPLQYDSNCSEFSESFSGLDVVSLQLNVTAGESTVGNLSDSSNAISVIQSSADFNVSGNIELGDGAAILQFTDHSIDNLLNSNVSDSIVTISASGNGAGPGGLDVIATSNVSLFVDSSIIFGDLNVAEMLFVDTIESQPANGSAGDILQSMNTDNVASVISATDAAFVSAASVQLTNTRFEELAIDANQSVSQLIQPFQLNENIGMTFTGSIDANIFADLAADSFFINGDPTMPVNGVFDVESGFLDDGFFENNNPFVNLVRVGAIIVNQQALDLVSFDSLELNAVQLEDVSNLNAAVTTLGDNYIETIAGHDLNVRANVDVTSIFSNTTTVAGANLTLEDGVAFRRLDNGSTVGLVNTLQTGFDSDPFVLVDPRSVLLVPGDAAFSDLNSQLDNALGFQMLDLFLGNPGESSFNVIIGWFVDGVSASDAINPEFQQTLLQNSGQTTSEFLLSDFTNFGQGISAHSLRIDSVIDGIDQALTLTNTTPFEQVFFGDQSFLLSQIFITNDARINLFENAGTTDLNFSQEVIPTRTVVQNPESIVVARPTFSVPETPGSAPIQMANFISLIQEPEARPIPTEQQPDSYFEIRFTSDDDGIFEESFRWTDQNDDPDAIRAAIERATLYEDEEFWPDTQDEDDGNWTNKIKENNRVKPGLYYIFEVQEGQPIEQPVDAPVDRTDIENLVAPENSNETTYTVPEETLHMAIDRPELSQATNAAMLGSSLLLGQCVINKQNRLSIENSLADSKLNENLFSRASRFKRRSKNRLG